MSTAAVARAREQAKRRIGLQVQLDELQRVAMESSSEQQRRGMKRQAK